MAYTQVPDELEQLATTVAAILDCRVEKAFHLLVRVLRLARKGNARIGCPPGLIPGRSDMDTRLLEASVGWKGERGMLVAALTHPMVALLEVVPDGLRIRADLGEG